ncbi:septum formation initiator [Rhodovulum imhoffii]|uniref:Septum formation initiator n=1 Tax=Rhodovulum imhoffii TaxID=365340 RepID=A0A2T5BPY3_9RHOB|nr:septum formation initiator family protein [Rhodovulum imhoffii]MBK5933425.1 septum formation initiator precursor [Rhodovulum imhoffii]PTN01134.1 septum formation initiator [Rhodovulum imhoffii]
MASSRNSPPFGAVLYVAVVFLLGMYFTFAAVQGDYGLFRRIQIEAEIDTLRVRHTKLSADLKEMRNKTRRMSDGYLDLDLVDEQARKVLGLVRADEVVIR